MVELTSMVTVHCRHQNLPSEQSNCVRKFGVLCVQAGPGEIGTELLMEPQHGHVWVERQQGTKDSGGGHGGGSFWMSDKVGGSVTLHDENRAMFRGF